MQKEFKEMVYEFAKSVNDFVSVKAAIVFGSVAKGEADKRSDVDILVIFNTKTNKFKDEEEIFNISQELGRKYDKMVQLVFSNSNYDKLDRKFIESVLSEGIIIYGNLPFIKADKLLLEHYAAINFEVSKLDKNNKNKLNRILFGHKTKKRYKSKIYTSLSEGLVKRYECKKLGSYSILVDFTHSKIFSDLVKNHRSIDQWHDAKASSQLDGPVVLEHAQKYTTIHNWIADFVHWSNRPVVYFRHIKSFGINCERLDVWIPNV